MSFIIWTFLFLVTASFADPPTSGHHAVNKFGIIKYGNMFKELLNAEQDPLEKIVRFGATVEATERYGRFLGSVFKYNESSAAEEMFTFLQEEVLESFETISNGTTGEQLEDWNLGNGTYLQMRRQMDSLFQKIDEMIRESPEARESAVEIVKQECQNDTMKNLTQKYDLLFRQACPTPTNFFLKRYARQISVELEGFASTFVNRDPFHDGKPVTERTKCAMAAIHKKVNCRMSETSGAFDELYFDLLRTAFTTSICDAVLDHQHHHHHHHPSESWSIRLKNVSSHVVQWTRRFQELAWPHLGETYAKGRLNLVYNEATHLRTADYQTAVNFIGKEFEDRETPGYSYQVVLLGKATKELPPVAVSLDDEEYHIIRFMNSEIHVFKHRTEGVASRMPNSDLEKISRLDPILHLKMVDYFEKSECSLKDDLRKLVRPDEYHGLLLLRNQKSSLFSSDKLEVPHGLYCKKFNNASSVFFHHALDRGMYLAFIFFV